MKLIMQKNDRSRDNSNQLSDDLKNLMNQNKLIRATLKKTCESDNNQLTIEVLN